MVDALAEVPQTLETVLKKVYEQPYWTSMVTRMLLAIDDIPSVQERFSSPAVLKRMENNPSLDHYEEAENEAAGKFVPGSEDITAEEPRSADEVGDELTDGFLTD